MIDQTHHRLRTPAAADYLGYSESTLEKKRLTGDGPTFIRLGRTIVYDTRDLDDWLAARRAIGTSDCHLGKENSRRDRVELANAGSLAAPRPRKATPIESEGKDARNKNQKFQAGSRQ